MLQLNFVRGFSHLDNWQETCLEYGTKMFDWRERIRADDMTNPDCEGELVDGAKGADAHTATTAAAFFSHPFACSQVGRCTRVCGKRDL